MEPVDQLKVRTLARAGNQHDVNDLSRQSLNLLAVDIQEKDFEGAELTV
jgi:hypothetical protein